MAACFAAKGYRVHGVDLDVRKVDAVNRAAPALVEPGLQGMMSAAAGRLTAGTSLQEAVRASNVIFIVVPTPSDPDGGFSLRYVIGVCQQIGESLRSVEGFPVVVLTSTVMPGATGGQVRSTLEQSSGKRCGSAFGLCYSPEFIALGSAIRDFSNPDMVLIGESDERSGDIVEALYRTVCDNRPHIARMSFVNAELTKLAVNAFLTTKITFGNLLARLCEGLPGANVDVVTAAAGLDSRIGTKYLKGAIGYGGPCFPRDNLSVIRLARQVGIQPGLAEATDRANRESTTWLATLVRSKLSPGGVVGILGLAYKPDTDVLEESQGLLLAQALVADGATVVAYDPAANGAARQILGAAVRLAESMEECAREADVLVITTPWGVFRTLDPVVFERRRPRPAVLIDCWRLLDRRRFEHAVEYLPLGVGSSGARQTAVSQPAAQERLVRA
jgi:UDPglucose 6-dehydrogenase